MPSSIIIAGSGSQAFASGGSNSIGSTFTNELLAQPLNLKADYGAKGDGVTDDTAAIQAWFTAGSVSNRPIFAEAGTYLFSTAITMANGSGGGAGTYGDNFVLRGSGPGITVFTTATNIAGFVFPHACQGMILENFSVVCTAGSSTHNGIHCDGSVSEGGTPGAGASMNNCRWSNILVSGFSEGFDLYYFSNSQVINCQANGVGTGYKVYGASNSVVFSGSVATSVTAYGYHLSAGTSHMLFGADITTATSGTAIGLEVDGAINVTVQDARCENRGSGYPAEVGVGSSVVFIGCNFQNFGGTATYGLHNSGATSALNSSFSGATNPVRQEVGSGQFICDNPGIVVDYYTSGTKTDSYAGQQLLGNPALQDTFSLILRGVSHGSTNLYGGAVIFDGKSSTLNYGVGFIDDFVSGDFGLYRSSSAGTIGLSGASAGTGQPTIPFFFHAGGTNQTTLGHNAATEPTLAQTLYVEGTIGASGVIIPPSFAVASLPASPGAGARATVTDQLTAITTIGATLTGGGSNKVPVYYNGSAWVSG
jgi:pectate lyase-like protein